MVTGATRGAGRGIAVALGAQGAVVYCAGRSTTGQPATPGRSETIDQTAALVDEAGGEGIAVRTDCTVADQVAALIARAVADHGKIDLLVNDVWGGDALIDWGKPFWEADAEAVRVLVDRAVVSHLLAARLAARGMVARGSGLIVEVTDGDQPGYRGHLLYDLLKSAVARLAYGMAWDLQGTGVTAVAVSPGFLRSEAVLDHFGVTEATWRDAIAADRHFAESETPAYIGRGIASLAADPDVRRFAGQVLGSWTLARLYDLRDVDGRQPDFPRYFDGEVDRIVARDPPMTDEERDLVLARYRQIHLDPDQAERAARLAAALGIG